MVEKMSTRGQLHHNIQCKLEGEPSDDSVVTKDAYHSAVDLEQSLMPDNACQRPANDFFYITDDSVGHLSFCEVVIKGLPGSVRALDDSGTQLSLVNPKVIDSLNLPPFGKVIVRGALGDPVCAALVNLKLRLPEVSEYTGVTCVVCDGLNLDLILAADIVTKLSLVRNELSNDMSDLVNVDVNMTAINAAAVVNDAVGTDQDDVNDMNDSADDVLNGDDVGSLITDDDNDEFTQSTRTANTQQIIQEQHEDRSLANCWSLAQRDKAGYFIKDSILYRKQKILGQEFEQLCLPKTRRAEAIKLAHQVGGGYLTAKKTKERLKLSFTWPTIAADVTQACQVCDECQKRRRVTVYDSVPITPVPCKEKIFDSWVMDCLGPLFPNEKVKYYYCVVLCDRVSHFPVAFCLSSLNAKCVCNALLQLFQMTGIPSVIQSDCVTNFTSKLTQNFPTDVGL